jgi:hypothetical protein
MKNRYGRGGSNRGGKRSAGGREEGAGSLEDEGRAPPRMTRSVGQLASSYAPMRHFAFENGLGVCIALPAPGSEPEGLSNSTKEQIRWRLREAAHAWFDQGSRFLLTQGEKGADREVALRKMLVDASLYDEAAGRFEFRAELFGFAKPKDMGYEPSPTTLVCGRCGLLKCCRDSNGMLALLRDAEQRCLHPKYGGVRSPSSCDWRQFEPILVHSSGAWRSVGADTLDVDLATGEIYVRRAMCESCNSTEFVVDTKKINLGGWFLRCAKCNVPRNVPWTDHDEEMLRLRNRPGIAIEDARMEKISYGASVAYSPHAETFVDLPEAAEILGWLENHRLDELREFIARRCGYVGAPPSPADAAAELEAKGVGGEAAEIAKQIRQLLVLSQSSPGNEAVFAEMLAREVSRAVERRLLAVKSDLPVVLTVATDPQQRQTQWAPRYDPFRLAVEHKALSETKLSGQRTEGSRAAFVPFTSPDDRLTPWREEDEAARGRNVVVRALKALGIVQAGLVPGFELCRFTFGYSRTSSTPYPQRPNKKVPVRLRLFPETRIKGEMKHPIYVLQQKNEAFYFQLDEELVKDWLATIGCSDARLLLETPSLAGALLESSAAMRMDRFLTEHRDTVSPNDPRQPTLYAAAYGLVHSLSHHIISVMSGLSGLDEGALGEYLFPVDLALVVYRSGMTMDLGDLSSLWRNTWEPFLNELRDYTRSLGCNVGSLCSEQGGACPDCLMIPEVTCVAGNRYLSRSLLTGEGLPSFMDVPSGGLRGYLDLSTATTRVTA